MQIIIFLLLAHKSQRLKWAFLIKICPLSVVIVVVVVVVVTFSHLYLLLHNHWANFNQTWVKGIQVWSNEDNNEIAKIHWQKFKNLFSRTAEPMSTKLGTMHPWRWGLKFVQMKGPSFFSGRIITKKRI